MCRWRAVQSNKQTELFANIFKVQMFNEKKLATGVTCVEHLASFPLAYKGKHSCLTKLGTRRMVQIRTKELTI